ncbi:MAG: DUF5107 domain-containing protein [Armatimonadetes bacterium]|nr:DUF5107 domain-containing protein [Armatimonadota bacterium]
MQTQGDTSRPFQEVVLENDRLKVVILPELGAKMTRLVRKATGRDFLCHNPYLPRLLKPGYGSAFDAFDVSGFDECFPTIGACRYPEDPWAGAELPDHGELWAVPWQCRREGDRLHFEVEGRALPYRFSMQVSLDGESVVLDYAVANRSPHPMKVLWSSHPLLAFPPGSRILLPEGARVVVGESRGLRLGRPGDTLNWPLATAPDGRKYDLSVLAPPYLGYVDKLYTARLREGWCGIRDASTGEGVLFTFPVEKVPYVGLWLDLGGWPEGQPFYQIALEPCSGTPDALDEAVRDWNSFAVVPARGELSWSLTMTAAAFESEEAMKKAAR